MSRYYIFLLNYVAKISAHILYSLKIVPNINILRKYLKVMTFKVNNSPEAAYSFEI